MKNLLILLFTLFTTSSFAQNLVNVNPDPTGTPWIVGGFRELSGEEIEKIPLFQLEPMSKRTVLPNRVDNSLNTYFRGIVLQSGGSCSQTSGIAYIYTYEINFMRGLSSKDSVNQYPSHFTYNFLNKGDDNNGSNYTDGWQLIKENGCPNLNVYGGLYPMGDKGWMSGYDKYVSGMTNRVDNYYRIKVNTPEGLETMKRYLYDHGNGSTVGGLVNFSAGAANAKNRPLPIGAYEERRRIIVEWSDPVDHAMTFVGYDDSVRYDVNGDKKYTNDLDITGDGIVDMHDWEIGAMILANTWSSTWGDTGRAYMLYRNLALKVSEGGISNGQVYVVVPEISVKPELILKLKMQHELRDRILVRIGISEYINDTIPEFEYTFSCLNRRGGAYPLQGINNDPIEMSLDVSSLLHHPDLEAVKFFLTVVEVDEDTSATGQILSWSLTDLRNGELEYKADDVNLEILNNTLTRSSLVLGNPDLIPCNLSVIDQGADYILNWNKPLDQTGLSGYMIYKDGEEYLFLTDSFTLLSQVPNGTRFKVRAKYGVEYSPPSNTVVITNLFHLPVAGSGYCLNYDGFDDCVDCGSGINIAKHDFTIEFWARRDPDPSNEFIIGGGKWNKTDQGLHIGFRDNKLMCGFWGDDVHTDEVYTDPYWHHWVITYDTTTMMQYIYRDGEVAGERKANAHFRGTGKFYIGCMSGNTWFFQGELDEVRVWNYVRSHVQLMDYMFMPLKGTEEGLLGYWKFDERSGSSLMDHSDSIDQGILNGFSDKAWVNSEAWANRNLNSMEDTILVYAGYSKNGNSLSCEITSNPLYGNLQIDTLNNKINYIPHDVFQGVDEFVFQLAEGNLVSIYSIKINGLFPESINKFNQSVVRMYPNPFHDKIFMEWSGMEVGSIRLIGIDGTVVMQKTFNHKDTETQVELFTGDLPKGIYVVILQSDSHLQTFKLFKVD